VSRIVLTWLGGKLSTNTRHVARCEERVRRFTCLFKRSWLAIATLASASIDKLSNEPSWLRFIQSSGKLPHTHYRAVPVMRSSRLTGMIVSLFSEDRPDGHSEQTLLESWGRFASLAVERRGLYEQLSFRAQYDSLTALLNRAALYDRVDSWIRANAATRNPMALIYLDLDGFKQINDTHGHGAGDDVLQHVSAHILESVRKTDLVARIGGDEFVIVLPSVGELTEAGRIADLVAAEEHPYMSTRLTGRCQHDWQTHDSDEKTPIC